MILTKWIKSSLPEHETISIPKFQAHEKNSACTPDLDESSDSGHASASSPGDEYLPPKMDPDMSFAFHMATPYTTPALQPQFAPHPAMLYPDMYHGFR